MGLGPRGARATERGKEKKNEGNATSRMPQGERGEKVLDSGITMGRLGKEGEDATAPDILRRREGV